MDYSVSWLIENEVVLMVLNSDIELTTGVQMLQDVATLMESSSHEKVHVIADASKTTSRMHNINETMQTFRGNRSPKWGFTVIIGGGGFTQLIAQIIFQISRIEVRFAKNQSTALEILYRIAPDLIGKPLTQSIEESSNK